MKLHPFTPERQVGVIYQVEGSFADVTFSAATKLPRSHFGEYLGRGEVGEFVVIDVGGTAAFGRLLRVGSTTNNLDTLTQQDHRVAVEGRIQLLSTLHLDGKATRGILRYPKVGDPVYAASAEAILSVLQGGAADRNTPLILGRLSVDDSVEVAVPLARLFGRHLAVVGATGSGKSWTLGHLAESVGRLGGKMILIDATGEFHTLGANAKHLAFGSLSDEPSGTTLVGIPHHLMREADRSAFINPSSGTQLPKLREAIRSLRLAHAITADNSATAEHQAIVDTEGTIKKAGLKIASFGSANKAYGTAMEDSNAPFDLKLLARQIQWECVWPTDRNAQDQYGGLDYTQIGYVSTLVSRINDLVQTAEIMGVIDPPTGTNDALTEIKDWLDDANAHVLRISLRNLTYANHLREIIVNILGQALLTRARNDELKEIPLVVAIDEAHQFFDVTVGDEVSSTRLNAFDSIAKEGRKYGLTVCMATQRPGDLPAGVLSQVGMTIVHRLADGRDRQRVEQAAAELDHSATRLLPGLVPGEAILMGVDFPVPVSVRMQAPVAPPASDGPRYDNWGNRPS
ncbi:ATP-binding protein [Gordonia caeni]|uniref:ATP-binding protein n=1 Tax=Gordonia caeni TaxID=1007097 RepID=A0ABP7PGC2_9ACTN